MTWLGAETAAIAHVAAAPQLRLGPKSSASGGEFAGGLGSRSRAGGAEGSTRLAREYPPPAPGSGHPRRWNTGPPPQPGREPVAENSPLLCWRLRTHPGLGRGFGGESPYLPFGHAAHINAGAQPARTTKLRLPAAMRISCCPCSCRSPAEGRRKWKDRAKTHERRRTGGQTRADGRIEKTRGGRCGQHTENRRGCERTSAEGTWPYPSCAGWDPKFCVRGSHPVCLFS